MPSPSPSPRPRPRPRPSDIMRLHEPSTSVSPWVGEPPVPVPLVISDYDPEWPEQFAAAARTIRSALGTLALSVEHIGSTSVPGLPAKPVIDIDLTVEDPACEAGYVPALETAGFTLRVREPAWHEHRCLVRTDPDETPHVNLHVFGPGNPETARHLLFRDRLRTSPEDFALYREAKLHAAQDGAALLVMDYNKAKEPAIHAIYERIFRAKGWLD